MWPFRRAIEQYILHVQCVLKTLKKFNPTVWSVLISVFQSVLNNSKENEMWENFVSSVIWHVFSDSWGTKLKKTFICRFTITSLVSLRNSSSIGSKRAQRNRLVHHCRSHDHYTAICRSPLRLPALWLPVEAPPKRLWCELSHHGFAERNVWQMLSAQQCSNK